MLARLAVALVVADVGVAPAVESSQATGLRIVVIAGEDAVNIIQQKTAVAPIVEVRDRNDQPVAGAVVSFAVRNGRATFAGARTLSVTTDVVGRAVASGLTPTGTGALQISASAAFQGQTAAVTIAQTNVLTAAQAAAIGTAQTAGGATGAGGSSGGGATTVGGTGGASSGGLSGLTLGLIAGGAGAGVLVATQAGKDNGGASPSSSGPPPSSPPPASPPSGPVSTLYDIVMAPAVTTVAQCPQAVVVPGTGPVGTALNLFSDGSFSGDLFSGPAGGPAARVVTISGRYTPTDISGTMACIAGGGPTGSLSGAGTSARYQGNWTFGGIGGTFTLTPK